ncbi:hypothetical protein [Acaryochloris sp. IP29b_bin.137]|uniref:hypothetical protein n=1 Tax=Acaryochloris sp. IP29b_bin.137 TaxID=2969217 RepID=UPI00260C03AF|nr:hypothetical protein [Acaryochloris sp. IP29b_bin.137]
MKYHPRNIQHILFLKLMCLQEKRSSQSGYSLVVTVAMLLILSTLLISAAVVNKVNSASTQASSKSNLGYYAAEAGLNLRAKEIKETFEDGNRPAGLPPANWQACTDDSGSNNGSGDFACKAYNLPGQTAQTFLEESSFEQIPVPEGEEFEGLIAQEYKYDLISVAETSENLPSAILGMSFKSRIVPIFQFAIFYENDLDFTIPPNMSINGRVHSNHDMYLNVAGSDYTLRIDGQVTAGGTLFRGDKADVGSQQCAGTVTIPTQGGTDLNLQCDGSNITPYVNDTTSPSDIDDWGSAIKLELPKLKVPSAGEFDPIAGSRYWDAADLRVVLRLDSTTKEPTGIQIRNQDGSVDTTLTNRLMNSCPVTQTTVDQKWWAGNIPNYLANEIWIGADSTTGFNVGDAVTIGSDIDSNVLSYVYDDGIGRRALRIKRQLGHNYQGTGNIVSENDVIRKAVVSTSDTFYNYREKHNSTGGDAGNYIRMLNVDIQALLDCAHQQDLMGTKDLDDSTNGGLVWYFTVDDSNASTNAIDKPTVISNDSDKAGSKYGVRIYNGSSLKSTISGAPEIEGLTIVSDEAVYVQGDYNLHTSTNPATDDWRPAAVMADTINVLSNAWNLDDSNGRGYSSSLPAYTIDFDSRIPTETTINAAFLSGVEITGGENGTASQQGPDSKDSGGVNNYPRFHEHWGASTGPGQDCDAQYGTAQTRHCFNYRGSFVSLFEPRRINSEFCGSYNEGSCNIYSPPVRNWDYESRFNDADDLPPLSPTAVYLVQELFQRNFDRTSSKTTKLFASLPTIPSIQPNFSL